jgi:hypothetical protein
MTRVHTRAYEGRYVGRGGGEVGVGADISGPPKAASGCGLAPTQFRRR